MSLAEFITARTAWRKLVCVIFADVVAVGLLALWRPPIALNACALGWAFGSTTVDLIVLCVVRSAAALLVGSRIRSGVLPIERAETVSTRWGHVSFLQLAYALAKGVSRALGAGSARCDDSTELFDVCCAAFGLWAYLSPMALQGLVQAVGALQKATGGPRPSDMSLGGGGLSLPLLLDEAEAALASTVALRKELKEAEKKKTADWRSSLPQLMALARPDAHLFWGAMLFAVLAALATSATSLWTGDALDALIKEGDGRSFKQQVLQLALISAAGALCTGLRGGLFSLIGVRVNVRIRERLFTHLLTLELAYFDETPTGDLTSRLSSDTAKVGDQISLNVNVLVRTGVQLVTTLAFMVHTSQPLAAVAVCSVPVVAVATKVYGEFVWALSKSMQDTLAASMKVAEEAFSSMLTVRSMAAEKSVARDFRTVLEEYFRIGQKQAAAYSLWQSFNTGLPNLMTCLLLYYGGRLVSKGELRSGRLVAFMLLTQSLSDSFNTLADMYSNIATALGAADKVFTLLAKKPAQDDAPNDPYKADDDDRAGQDVVPRWPPKARGEIALRDVEFSYPTRPDAKVLRGVSLVARPGSVLALVGPSGSGKSSVLALVQHFYSPDAGSVTLDGVDVGLAPHAWLHRQVAMVGQEPVLFARSIKRNVKYALEGSRHEPDDAAVENALKMAHALDFVLQLPEGLETDVGERGTQLSGGQKQRIAIARALARKPAVLLLDEATSALDAESERNVQNALNELIKEMRITVLVVAHRLSTVRDADNICVMKHGLIVEQGTHDDLFAKDGVYADLVRRQANIAKEDSSSMLAPANNNPEA